MRMAKINGPKMLSGENTLPYNRKVRPIYLKTNVQSLNILYLKPLAHSRQSKTAFIRGFSTQQILYYKVPILAMLPWYLYLQEQQPGRVGGQFCWGLYRHKHTQRYKQVVCEISVSKPSVFGFNFLYNSTNEIDTNLFSMYNIFSPCTVPVLSFSQTNGWWGLNDVLWLDLGGTWTKKDSWDLRVLNRINIFVYLGI